MADYSDKETFTPRPVKRRRGRGAVISPANRYLATVRDDVDDGWFQEPEAESVATSLSIDHARHAITYNTSPDVGFDRSINPYRGCEHGCVYCFARPTHAYLDLSPGLDFETRLFYKPDIVARLKEDLTKPGYRCAPVAVGINTDAYQPIERRLKLTRAILEVLTACGHPFSLVTKSAMVERDLDLLVAATQKRLVSVAVSITTLDSEVARHMEPRATSPARRLQTISTLAAAGVPVTVLVAPVIPVLTEHELESILRAARDAGACEAGYVLLRLPLEIKEMFTAWLHEHQPDRAKHVLARMADMHAGTLYNAQFGARMRGRGPYADLLEQRYVLARRRLGFPGVEALDTTQFVPPNEGPQLTLF
jgi:DNA repair photolyase